MTKSFSYNNKALFFYDYNNNLVATYYIHKERLRVNKDLTKNQIHYIYNNIKYR